MVAQEFFDEKIVCGSGVGNVRRFTRRRESDSFEQRMKSKGYRDPVVEVYMRDVDRTLLRENLKLTPAQRLEKLVSFSSFAKTLREAGRRSRLSKKP